jgi:hypothetical protein
VPNRRLVAYERSSVFVPVGDESDHAVGSRCWALSHEDADEWIQRKRKCHRIIAATRSAYASSAALPQSPVPEFRALCRTRPRRRGAGRIAKAGLSFGAGSGGRQKPAALDLSRPRLLLVCETRSVRGANPGLWFDLSSGGRSGYGRRSRLLWCQLLPMHTLGVGRAGRCSWSAVRFGSQI